MAFVNTYIDCEDQTNQPQITYLVGMTVRIKRIKITYLVGMIIVRYG